MDHNTVPPCPHTTQSYYRSIMLTVLLFPVPDYYTFGLERSRVVFRSGEIRLLSGRSSLASPSHCTQCAQHRSRQSAAKRAVRAEPSAADPPLPA